MHTATDPVWSVVGMVALCLLLASYSIYYVLKMAWDEENS